MPQFLPDDGETDYTLIPDLVVMDIAYRYTGLRDANGNKILRRVSRPIGFTARQDQTEYVVDHDERQEPMGMDHGGEDIHEGSEVEGE